MLGFPDVQNPDNQEKLKHMEFILQHGRLPTFLIEERYQHTCILVKGN
jgi:hypothetical protein